MPRKFTQEEIENIYKKEGYSVHSKYINQRTKLKTTCPKEHVYMSYPGNFIHRKNRCSTCDAENISKRQMTPYEEIIKICKSKSLTFLWSKEEYEDKYIGPKKAININESKVPLMCSNSHKFKLTMYALKSCKYGCDKCFKQKRGKITKLTLDFVKNELNKKGYSLLSDKYINNKTKLYIKCSKNHEFYMRWNDVDKRHGCPICNGRRSLKEQELLKWVKTIHPDATPINFNKLGIDNTQREIDVYIPSIRLGIEFNGLLWHSEKYLKDKKQHEEKYKLCKKHNIQLITIFEHEWDSRKDQIKGYLESKIVKQNKIYARKCELLEISIDQSKKFLEKYHIQGSTGHEKAFGLFLDNNLLAVVTGGKHHRQGQNQYVLSRLCFKRGYTVVGGASRLIKALKSYAKTKNYKEMVSWSDNRWSNGNVYKNTNWSPEPLRRDYFYYNIYNKTVHSKQSCQKRVLSKKLKIPKESATETEMANLLNLYKVWDCGKMRWSIEL